MRNDWHPWKDREPISHRETRALRIEFILLLTLVAPGLLASLLSAVGLI